LLSVLVIIEESANNFSVYELTVLWQHTWAFCQRKRANCDSNTQKLKKYFLQRNLKFPIWSKLYLVVFDYFYILYFFFFFSFLY
jgi:hypothetical protein